MAGRRRSSVGGGKFRLVKSCFFSFALFRGASLGSLKEDESEPSERQMSLQEDEEEEEEQQEVQEVKPRRDELSSPYWIEDDQLGKGKVDFLKQTEVIFWQNMIKKYLLPFPIPSPIEAAKAKQELADYRDSFIFTFVMINVLYIVGIIMLQFQETMKIDWIIFQSFDVKGEDGLRYAFDYTQPENSGSAAELVIQRTNVDKLDVIGLGFLVMFSSVVVAQMIGMFFHRWQTCMR